MIRSTKKRLKISILSMVLLGAIVAITIVESSNVNDMREILVGKRVASMFLLSDQNGSDTDERCYADSLNLIKRKNCSSRSEWLGLPTAVESALIAGETQYGGVMIWLMITTIGVALGVFISVFDRFSADPAVQVEHALAESQQLREQITDQHAELGKANPALALQCAVTQALGDSATLGEEIDR
jgi:hypothetical protein